MQSSELHYMLFLTIIEGPSWNLYQLAKVYVKRRWLVSPVFRVLATYYGDNINREEIRLCMDEATNDLIEGLREDGIDFIAHRICDSPRNTEGTEKPDADDDGRWSGFIEGWDDDMIRARREHERNGGGESFLKVNLMDPKVPFWLDFPDDAVYKSIKALTSEGFADGSLAILKAKTNFYDSFDRAGWPEVIQ